MMDGLGGGLGSLRVLGSFKGRVFGGSVHMFSFSNIFMTFYDQTKPM